MHPLFPDLKAKVYLNHAGVSPASTVVRDAAMGAIHQLAQLGSGAVPWLIEQRRQLKQSLARLIGARAEDLAVVPSTSRGVLDVALCLPWRRGERILCFEGEFPTNVTPWQRAAAEWGLSIEFVPIAPFARSHEEGLAVLQAALQVPTRLVAVSAVQFQTGLRMPIAEMAALCHAAGAELSVDAIQAIGIVPFDVGELDYVICGSHKWLMGLEGAGFVYARPDRAPALVPRAAAWLSHEDPVRFLFEGPGELRYDRPIRRSIDFLEMGAQNAVGLCALGASVDLLLERGPSPTYAHTTAILDRLEAELLDRGFASARARFAAGRSGTLSVRPPAPWSHASFGRALAERGIIGATPDGWLRLAPHWHNSMDQVPTVLSAVDAVLTSG